MPIPKLLTTKGKIMPEWDLTAAQLEKERAAFRAAASIAAADEGAKKAPKKKAAPKSAAKASDAGPAVVSSLVSIKPKDLVIDKVKMAEMLKLVVARKRKDQKDFSATEWNTYIDAIEAIAAPGAAAPTYKDFVNVHVKAMTHAGHEWGVHTMMGMKGRNFLAWHREYLAKLEARLMLVNPLVTVPYWNWIVNRAIPTQLKNPSDLAAWGITRGSSFNPSNLPTQSDINTVMGKNTFDDFQAALEPPHGWVHNAVGGTMQTSSSPADPLFWLHHSFVDKLWADWQKTHTSASQKPSNLTETMQPPPIITRKVSEVLKTSALGYIYA